MRESACVCVAFSKITFAYGNKVRIYLWAMEKIVINKLLNKMKKAVVIGQLQTGHKQNGQD